MIEQGIKIALVPAALPVTEFLTETFCYLSKTLIFSPQKLTAKHIPASQNSPKQEITKNDGK